MKSTPKHRALSVKLETKRLWIWINVKYLPLLFAVYNKLSQIIIIQLNIWVMNNRNDMRWWFKCGNSAFYFISRANLQIANVSIDTHILNLNSFHHWSSKLAGDQTPIWNIILRIKFQALMFIIRGIQSHAKNVCFIREIQSN